MSHAKERHTSPLATGGRAQKRSAGERLMNDLGSCTEHKEFPSKNLSRRAQKAEPLLNCGHHYLQSEARRGCALWVMQGENTEKHRASPVAATWCQPARAHASVIGTRQAARLWLHNHGCLCLFVLAVRIA